MILYLPALLLITLELAVLLRWCGRWDCGKGGVSHV